MNLREQLIEAVVSTPLEELPDLIGLLEATKARAQLRLAAREPTSEARELVDAAQMARLLGVPENWVRDKARAGALPVITLGHYVRFQPDEVLAAVRKLLPGHAGRLCIPGAAEQRRSGKDRAKGPNVAVAQPASEPA